MKTGVIMNENEFMRQQQDAVERMREMSSRAAPIGTNQPMPPVPPFVRVQQNRGGGRTQQSYQHNAEPQPDRRRGAQKAVQNSRPAEKPAAPKAMQNSGQSGGLFGGLNLPFLDMLSNEGDISLIIGLLLILMSEKADKKLLFALIYILM